MELLKVHNCASWPKRSESYSLVPQVTSRVDVEGNIASDFTVTTEAKPSSDWSAHYVLGGVNAHRMGTHRTSLESVSSTLHREPQDDVYCELFR